MAENHSTKRVCRRYGEEEKQEMARRYLAGETLPQVAASMGCPTPTVWYILKRLGVKCRPQADQIRGRKLRPEHVEKVRKANTGRKRSVEFRRKMSAIQKARGENLNWFVDGKGKERDDKRKQEMDRLEYRLWREAVFKRDDFTCQECGQRGGALRADHIKSWKNFPALRYDVANGRTLCDPCHRKTPTYGSKINSEE